MLNKSGKLKTMGRLSVLLPVLLLAACGSQPTVTVPVQATAPTSAAGLVAGQTYELHVSGAQSENPVVTLGQPGQLAAQELVDVQPGVTLTSTGRTVIEAGGRRYIQVSLSLNNASGRTLPSLSVVPLNTDDTDGNAANNAKAPTIGATPFSALKDTAGAAMPDALASQLTMGQAKAKDAAGNLSDLTSVGTFTQSSDFAQIAVTAPAGLSAAALPAAWVSGDLASGAKAAVTLSVSFPVTAETTSLNGFTLAFTVASNDQRTLAFTPGVHPAADASDPNWLGQAIVRANNVDYLVIKTYSASATAMQASVRDQAGAGRETALNLTRDPQTNIWYTAVPLSSVRAGGATTPSTGLFDGNLTYGLRAWGPNWPKDPAWVPGSSAGFISDVDSQGNRFDPNKLLVDPYALEVTRDYQVPGDLGGDRYTTGAANRNTDTGAYAPRGYVALTRNADWANLKTQATTGRITRAQKDDVVYEAHVRGLTKQDGAVTAQLQGTYAGAAQKAQYLKSLGVTAVEFLPIQETENDANDADGGTRSSTSTEGDNYWGYMTTNFFAPDRRYASDRSAGGPTREFAAMAKTFKDAGIKVVTDVVYNHTGEGGIWGSDATKLNLWSMRGLDNPTYYLLSSDKQSDYDITGTGNTMNTRNATVQHLIIDSLQYQRNILGVDGFRFDLGIALGNTYDNTTNPSDTQRFYFSGTDANTALAKVAAALPGVYLSSEPWGLAPNGQGYQLGKFPAGWSEWNGQFRDYFRRAQNKLEVAGKEVTPGNLVSRFAGSSDLFGDDGRKPWNSVNFLTVHDGFTLKDLYSCNGKNNLQAWPYGPSDGGTSDEDSWDSNDTTSAPSQAQLQRQQARTGMVFLAMSQGVPLINGGDEMLRSLNCNNNAYNLDSSANWLNWSLNTDQQNFQSFSQQALNFRLAHPALRRAEFFTGQDSNGNGYKDVTWFTAGGQEAPSWWFDSTSEHALAFLVDGTEQNDSMMYVAYNGWKGDVTYTLPALPAGLKWYRVTDTAWWGEGSSQFDAGAAQAVSGAGGGGTYGMKGRTALILIAKP